MELKKRKYKRKEVSGIVNVLKREYTAQLVKYKEKVVELAKENTYLKTELEELDNKERLISSALIKAEKSAFEFEQQAKVNYDLEMERLKRFASKWDEYFRELMDKYPLYPKVKQACEIIDKVSSCENNNEQTIKDVEKVFDKNAPFNPKGKIYDYISATSDNGFNMDEVLNPGELELEDLCKELGLIED